MPYIAVRCPHCQRDHIVKHGTTRRETQRSLCQNTACALGSFLRNGRNRGCVPAVKQQIWYDNPTRFYRLDRLPDTSGVLRTATTAR